MAAIIRGTTPTLRFTFKYIDPEQITSAALTIKQNRALIIEKDLSEAIVSASDHSIAYKLAQEETLSFVVGKITIMHNWLLDDGTRGASAETTITVEDNHKNEVMT